jgi:hypothetical protein
VHNNIAKHKLRRLCVAAMILNLMPEHNPQTNAAEVNLCDAMVQCTVPQFRPEAQLVTDAGREHQLHPTADW